MDWRNRHTDEKTRARIDPVIAALKEQGVIRFAATGYCFGGECLTVKTNGRLEWSTM